MKKATETRTSEVQRPEWMNLFESILSEPGRLGEFYSAFHSYSLGNQVIAMEQMRMRGIPISPIASFKGWKEKGRSVAKGQKAIALWMPVVAKGSPKNKACSDDGDAQESNDGASRLIFVMRNNWFAFSQTNPDEHAETPSSTPPVAQVIGWDKALAMSVLGIREVPFEHVDGNCQGFARPTKMEVAISPFAALPHKTLFHELAHCLLHGKEPEDFVCGADLDKSIKEAEAESTAFLCCAALGLPGLEEARGYVQSWLSFAADREAFKKCAARVFRAADRILKAGKTEQEEVAHVPSQPVFVEAVTESTTIDQLDLFCV